MPEGIDMTLDDLKNQLNDVRQGISFLRKKGAHTAFVEMKIASIPAKIKYVEVTRDFKDVQKVTSLMEEAKSEIKDAESLLVESMTEKNLLGAVLYLMDRMEELLRTRQTGDARRFYMRCYEIYQKLNNEQKKEVFKRLSELRGRM